MANDGLVGRWRLVSWSARADDGTVTHPLGERAEGSLIYTAGGWVSVQLADANRVSLPTMDPLRGGSEADRAAAFSTYSAYCGTYQLEGDGVVHRVLMSLFPNWVGTELRRQVELSGDDLALRIAPRRAGKKLVSHELRWRREE